jgi:hypothetical protein
VGRILYPAKDEDGDSSALKGIGARLKTVKRQAYVAVLRCRYHAAQAGDVWIESSGLWGFKVRTSEVA